MSTTGGGTLATTVGELFREATLRHADREAVVYRQSRWSYRDLAHRVSAGAAQLLDVVGRRPHRVAIVGSNHPAYVVGYYAAHSLGAVTVEVGRDESLEAIRQAIVLANAEVLLTDRPDLVPGPGGMPVVLFDAFLAACEGRPSPQAGAEPARGPANREAAIVFTSGTTGAPKGVVLSHGNILFVVHAVCRYLALKSTDRYALVLPLAHTYGKSNLLTATAAGAAVVFVESVHDVVGFFRRIAEERCTVLSVVPFHLNVMATRGVPSNCDLTAIRVVTSSGGPLPAESAMAIGRLLPRARLFPMYGLTESATRVAFLSPELLSSKPGSVGKPLPGVEVQIRSDDDDACAPGVIGHISVRGPNVMLGYLGDPELTAATLVDGWLRTGDIGYVDTDGCLFITGRLKEIIKVAGERISPAEIEEVLVSHARVAEAAIVGAPDRLLGETVWAYVVPAGTLDPTELAAFCAARLSPHKVPRRFIEVTQIPRTPTGKVRRHLLKEHHS